MIVTVHLHTILQLDTPGGPQRQLEMDLPAGSTLGSLLKKIPVKLEPEFLLLVVNGHLVDEEQELSEGDEVHLMPAISGGRGENI